MWSGERACWPEGTRAQDSLVQILQWRISCLACSQQPQAVDLQRQEKDRHWRLYQAVPTKGGAMPNLERPSEKEKEAELQVYHQLNSTPSQEPTWNHRVPISKRCQQRKTFSFPRRRLELSRGQTVWDTKGKHGIDPWSRRPPKPNRQGFLDENSFTSLNQND